MTAHKRCAGIEYVDANIVALGAELGRKLDAIEQKRDRRYASIKDDLRKQGDDIVELNEKVDRHTATLDRHTATLDRHTATLDRHTATLDRHTATFEEHGRKLDRILGLLEAA